MTDPVDTPRPAEEPPSSHPPVPGPETSRGSIWGKVIVGVVALLALAGVVGAYVRVPYVIVSPGDATPVDQYIEIRGAKTYPHRGSLMLLTVRVSNGRPNFWRFVEASLDDDTRVLGEKEYFGTVPRGRVERQSIQMMNESQLAAKQAALTRLGYDVTVTGKGARVEQVVPDSPAAEAGLRRGDVIVAIDGAPVAVRDQVGQIVQAAPVGTTFAVTVRRDGEERPVDVTSATAPSGDIKGRPFLGIGASTFDLKFDFPVDIAIDPDEITGPSGGLAFALTIMDDLTRGDLTGGAKVAVTGEIDGAGNVGQVGGVPQKAVAARNAGARLMIVPKREVRSARRTAGDMKVVGVRTLDDALRALSRNGGAELPAQRRTTSP